ncbi:pilus assembly protein [Acinetobacter sp. ANC 4558]|uniref:PilZ domain-containing protein n=1 Tax=Acinetobacter sp. ANC 4558 TaxID=1977876 RepID=UPI000A34B87E|nr:PilZ domain-containing protein [Acinetobacter sp. ANC 4558]OTG86084.1 pilus assembly protein [Acinetobacter sp. ANC 4558]
MHDVIQINITDKETLYHSYMPYVIGGGLFIPSKKIVTMGEEVSVSATLPDYDQEILLKGKVIWISQKQNGVKPQGFGIQLSGEEGIFYKVEAEKLLAGIKASARSSYTM